MNYIIYNWLAFRIRACFVDFETILFTSESGSKLSNFWFVEKNEIWPHAIERFKIASEFRWNFERHYHVFKVAKHGLGLKFL